METDIQGTKLMIFHQGWRDHNSSRLFETTEHIDRINHHPMNFKFTLWDKCKVEPLHKSDMGYGQLFLGLPSNDIFAAYASHAIFVNQKLTQNNRFFYKQREDLKFLLSGCISQNLTIGKLLNNSRMNTRIRKGIERSTLKETHTLQMFNRDGGCSSPHTLFWQRPRRNRRCKKPDYWRISQFPYRKQDLRVPQRIIRRVSPDEDEPETKRWTNLAPQCGHRWANRWTFRRTAQIAKEIQGQMNPSNQPGQKSSKVLGL